MRRLVLALCTSLTVLTVATATTPAHAHCEGAFEGLPVIIDPGAKIFSNQWFDSGNSAELYCYYAIGQNRIIFSVKILKRGAPPQEVINMANAAHYCRGARPQAYGFLIINGSTMLDPGWTIRVDIDPMGFPPNNENRLREAKRLIDLYRSLTAACPQTFR